MQNNQLAVCKNVDFFTEYGTTKKIKGNKRVLATPITGSPPVSWIGFYKDLDFAGRTVRETLFQAGTSMYQLSGTSATSIATGQPSGLFRSHDQFGRFLLITGQDPFSTGTLGNRYKFDGFKLSRWGVDAPGSEETVIEPFSSTAGFTTSNCTIADETAIAYAGTSQKMTKTAGNNTCYSQKTAMPVFGFNNQVEDRCRIFIYIPEIVFRKLEGSSACFKLWFSSNNDFSGATGDWTRYDFYVGDFQTGWNTLYCDFDIFPSGTIGATNDWSAAKDSLITAARYEFNFDNAYNADAIPVYLDQLVALDRGVPLVTPGSAGTTFPGGVGQSWSYVVTYENLYGYESNASPLQGTDIVADEASEITESLIWGYDNHAHASLTYSGSAPTHSNDTTNKTEGTGSTQMNHTASATPSWVNVNDSPFDLSDVEGNLLYVDVWISTGVRADLATDGLRVQIGDQATVNYYEWRFDRSTIEENAFTTLTIDLADPDEVNGVVDLSAVNDIRVLFAFKDAVVTAAAGELKVDNLRVETSNSYDSWELSEIPVSEDPDVNKRHIYRTVANGVTHFYVGTIYDNATTTYSDTVVDGSLGTRQPPQPGQFFDNTVPPNAGIVKVWKQTVFMAGDPKDPATLYFSLDENPEAFPIINGFELDSPITGIFEARNGLVVTTEKDIWTVIGDNPDYFVDRMIRNVGNVGFRACGETKLYGWVYGRDAIRLYDLADTNRFSEPIGDKISAISRKNIKHTWSLYSQTTNNILFFHQNASGTYDTAYCYQHLLDDVREGFWWQLDLPSGLEFRCGEEIEDSNGDNRIYVGGNDGMVYELLTLGSGGYNHWVNAANVSTTMTMELQSIYMRGGSIAGETHGSTGRWKPSFIEVRSRVSTGAVHNYTIRVDTADGACNDQTVRDTQTITVTFPANVNLQRVRLKDLVSGEYVRINIKNSDNPLVEPYLNGVRLYIEARPGQFPVSGTTPGGRS
jgi:hypothetical protein